MKIKFYNIHDIITFKIINNTNVLHKKISNLEIEYKNFECKIKIDKPDFTIYIGEFTPDITNCHILDENYYIKENYLFCKQDVYKIAKWRFELSGFENGETTVKISCNIFGELFLAAYLIDFLIQLKLTEKGYPIVHASCVNKDNKGYLFSSRGGGGKTTTALKLLDQGFHFLGDNYIIIHDGVALGFLSPLNIFSYNLTKNLSYKLNTKEKILLKIKSILYRLTFGFAKIFSQFNPRRIFPNSIINQTKLNIVFLLIPKNSLSVHDIKREDLITQLIYNQQLDFLFFDKYMTEYSTVFPHSNFARHWELYKKQLEKQIPMELSMYKIEVPPILDDKFFKEIQTVISNERNNKL